MAFAAPLLVVLATCTCVVGLMQTKDTSSCDELFDVVLSLRNEVVDIKRKSVEHEHEISQLKQKNAEHEEEILRLKKKNAENDANSLRLKKKNEEHEHRIAVLEEKNAEREDEVLELKGNNAEQENKISGLREKLRNSMVGQQEHHRARERRLAGRVAFSAYLSHDQQHIGIDQKIKFDTVLLNKGNGYNPNLGAFIAPTEGLYLVAYTISKWRTGESRVRLVKNGNMINGAAVEVEASYALEQSGNVALVELDVGDAIYVEEYHNSDALISGSTTDRWTTFSGVLLM